MFSYHQSELRNLKLRRGFTLVELLVVIAIIGVLVALLLPAVQAAREAARRSQCLNQIRQLALGCHIHCDAKKELPAGGTLSNQLSWLCYILPYVEESAMYDQMRANNAFESGTVSGGTDNGGVSVPSGSVHKSQYYGQFKLSLIQCPSSSSVFTLKSSAMLADADGNKNIPLYQNHYLGVAGPVTVAGKTYRNNSKCNLSRGGSSDQGLLEFDYSVKLRQVTDGLSKTLLLGEINYDWARDEYRYSGDSWVRGIGLREGESGINNYSGAMKNIALGINLPVPAQENNNPFASPHAGGAHFALGDGSARMLNEDIDFTLYQAIGSRDGDESAALP